MLKIRILITISCFSQIFLLAQNKSNTYKSYALLREGNDAVVAKEPKKAAALFQKSLQQNPSYYKAAQNLGNVYFEQHQLKNAAAAYQKAYKLAKNDVDKVKSAEKIGDVFKQNRDYANAAKAYKNALLKAPNNEIIREKLVNVLRMLKDSNDQNKNQKGKNPKDNQQKDNNQSNKDSSKKDKQKDPSKNNQKKQSNQPANQAPNQSNLSKDQIHQLLNAMEKEEQKTFKKINAQKIKVSSSTHEKEW